MKIVVIGGTGLIGSKLVQKLRTRGHDAVAATPTTGVDTITGAGLARALKATDVIVDVSNPPLLDDQSTMTFFKSSGENLIAAGIAAGVRHHVALSVVGTDRLQDSGYFRAKLVQERLIMGSPIPYTIVHATQFFEFIRTIAALSTEAGSVRIPPVLFRPIAAEDVAEAIAETALAAALNATLDIAGPDMFTMDEAVRKVLGHDRDLRVVIADPEARYYGVAVSEETLVPAASASLGTTRLDWWLANVPKPPEN